MRIASAAQSGGDIETAVGLYRQAAALNPQPAAALTAAGDALVAMGQINEAVAAYRAALEPLSVAYSETPQDPKVLQLLGVADDFAGRHATAQAYYARGLELLPGDRGLSVNLALSLALSGRYEDAVAVLSPLALGPAGTPGERQTLALIHVLRGDSKAA